MSDPVITAIISSGGTTLVAIVAILTNNKRFDDINKRFDDINKRLDEILKRLEGFRSFTKH